MYEKLTAIVGTDRVKCNEQMKNHTTFRIGGPADFYIESISTEELQNILEACRMNGAAYAILGNGSNLLVSDLGFRGVVIKMQEEETAVCIREETAADGSKKLVFRIPAGMKLARAAMQVAEFGCTGFEYAAGIPGTIGGAVVMNAGAYDQTIEDTILGADILKEDQSIAYFTKEDLQLGYRTSIIQREPYIVLSADFAFPVGDKEAVLKRIDELNRMRKEKQPLEYPSAGSTFKRPIDNFAGKLIMESGLRGYRVNDAAVSDKHCGFVINLGEATAKDVQTLLIDVVRIVKEKTGVTLEPEIKFLGEI